MKSTKMVKRIKENITIVEYTKLLAATCGSSSIRENTKLNILRAHTILFYTGMRLN